VGKTYLGIDIGSTTVKFAMCENNHIIHLAKEPVPAHLLQDGNIASMEDMSSFLRSAAQKHQIKCKDTAIIVPSNLVFSRRITVPYMTEEQLKVNLPYEFRDFITKEKEYYLYDYAVVHDLKDESGAVTHLDLMIAAVLKSTINEYRTMLRKAGFRLRIAAPVIFAYANLLRKYEQQYPADMHREYCIIDLGHTATRIHIFSGNGFEVTRIIDFGCEKIDSAIASELQIDEETASSYKINNKQDVLSLESCTSIYHNIAIEIMRAINFYWFDKPNSNLADAYYCGGGSKIGPLLDIISITIGLKLQSIERLLPDNAADHDERILFPSAVGITQL